MGPERFRRAGPLAFAALLVAVFVAAYQYGKPPPGSRPAGPGPPGGYPVATAYPPPTAPPIGGPTPLPPGVLIVDVVLRDPAFPSESGEYVQIVNNTEAPVSVAGWRLVNASRPERASYVFPAYILGADYTVAVFSQQGNEDLEVGDFYWDQSGDVWQVGDRAELRDAQGNLVATLVVPSQE